MDSGQIDKQRVRDQSEILATTFNAAAGDRFYCNKVDSKGFIEDHGKNEDLLLLQEAGKTRDNTTPQKEIY